MSHKDGPTGTLLNLGSNQERNVDVSEEGESGRKVETAEFILVTRKGRRGRKNKRGKQPPVFNFDKFHHALDSSQCASVGDSQCEPVFEETEEILRKINLSVKNLRESQFYSALIDKLKEGFEDVYGSSSSSENLKILCFGLGSFSSNLLARLSRYQLALLILLRDQFSASCSELYDPVFTTQEKSILQGLGFKVLDVNENGKRRVEGPTLVFMPHCPHQLVNNFLYANWGAKSLTRCFILCNSISNTLRSLAPSYVNENLFLYREAFGISSEIQISNTFLDSEVFNDTSLHVFPPQKVENLPDSFWTSIACPVYLNQDFISG